VILLFATSEAAAANSRHVLLLHAFGHPYSPWSDMAGSFRAEFIKKSPEPITLRPHAVREVDVRTSHLTVGGNRS
jgi:hypothetical protein